MKLTILGSGRGAWAIGSLFRSPHQIERIGSRQAGEVVLNIPAVSLEEAAATATELLLFAVPDDAVLPLYERLQPSIPAQVFPFHLSGVLSSGIFHRHRGFSFHPLRSLPAAGAAVDLAGTLFVWEGSGAAREFAGEMASLAGGRLAQIDPALKPLYHAAAVFGANYVAVVADEANRLMREAGIGDARTEVGELALSAIRNWMDQPEAPFTGPIARGDAGTVENHTRALESMPAALSLYRRLGARLLDSVADSLPVPALQKIRRMLRTDD